MASHSMGSAPVEDCTEQQTALSSSDSIIVAVRMRPLGARERGDDAATDEFASRWELSPTSLIEETAVARRAYHFDRVHDGGATNTDVYDACAKRVVSMALQGVNGSVLAYGPTGSGKTHTMLGSDSDPGVVPRAVHDIFSHAEAAAAAGTAEFLIRCSYLEVYNEEVTDLLAADGEEGGGSGGYGSPKLKGPSTRSSQRVSDYAGDAATATAGAAASNGRNLRIVRDDPLKGAIIEGLSEHIVVNQLSVLNLIARGEAARHYGSTRINEASSRSHTIFRMVLESRKPGGLQQQQSQSTSSGISAPAAGESTALPDGGGGPVQLSVLNLVDLAGSERSDAAGELCARTDTRGAV